WFAVIGVLACVDERVVARDRRAQSLGRHGPPLILACLHLACEFLDGVGFEEEAAFLVDPWEIQDPLFPLRRSRVEDCPDRSAAIQPFRISGPASRHAY